MHGIESGDFYLKLCGAGGGGYLLGFAHNRKDIEQLEQQFKLEVLELL